MQRAIKISNNFNDHISMETKAYGIINELDYVYAIGNRTDMEILHTLQILRGTKQLVLECAEGQVYLDIVHVDGLIKQDTVQQLVNYITDNYG